MLNNRKDELIDENKEAMPMRATLHAVGGASCGMCSTASATQLLYVKRSCSERGAT